MVAPALKWTLGGAEGGEEPETSDRAVSEGASEVELGLTELVYCGLMAACATGVLGAPGALGRLGSLRLGMGAPLGDACCSLGVTSSMETLLGVEDSAP